MPPLHSIAYSAGAAFVANGRLVVRPWLTLDPSNVPRLCYRVALSSHSAKWKEAQNLSDAIDLAMHWADRLDRQALRKVAK